MVSHPIFRRIWLALCPAHDPILRFDQYSMRACVVRLIPQLERHRTPGFPTSDAELPLVQLDNAGSQDARDPRRYGLGIR